MNGVGSWWVRFEKVVGIEDTMEVGTRNYSRVLGIIVGY